MIYTDALNNRDRFEVVPTTPLAGATGPAFEILDTHLKAAAQRVCYLAAGLKPRSVYTDRQEAEADAYWLNGRLAD